MTRRIMPNTWLTDAENVDWLGRHAPFDIFERLDARTPMYLPLMEHMPAQQRKIVATAARLGEFTATQLADEARLPSNIVSAQLGRLAAEGWFDAIDGRPRRWTFAALVDEVRVWLILRSGRRRDFEVVRA